MAHFVSAARGNDPAAIIRPQFLKTIHTATSAGLRLAILSNELDLFYGTGFREKLPFLAQFHIIHDATYTQTLKPDPRAYLDCVDDLSLSPADCLFIDDQSRNIEGALAVGLDVVKFDVTNPTASYAEVHRKAGLKVGEEIQP